MILCPTLKQYDKGVVTSRLGRRGRAGLARPGRVGRQGEYGKVGRAGMVRHGSGGEARVAWQGRAGK